MEGRQLEINLQVDVCLLENICDMVEMKMIDHLRI
jgi:hypothetical protein